MKKAGSYLAALVFWFFGFVFHFCLSQEDFIVHSVQVCASSTDRSISLVSLGSRGVWPMGGTNGKLEEGKSLRLSLHIISLFCSLPFRHVAPLLWSISQLGSNYKVPSFSLLGWRWHWFLGTIISQGSHHTMLASWLSSPYHPGSCNPIHPKFIMLWLFILPLSLNFPIQQILQQHCLSFKVTMNGIFVAQFKVWWVSYM